MKKKLYYLKIKKK